MERNSWQRTAGSRQYFGFGIASCKFRNNRTLCSLHYALCPLATDYLTFAFRRYVIAG
jgi:hypothetical protein